MYEFVTIFNKFDKSSLPSGISFNFVYNSFILSSYSFAFEICELLSSNAFWIAAFISDPCLCSNIFSCQYFWVVSAISSKLIPAINKTAWYVFTDSKYSLLASACFSASIELFIKIATTIIIATDIIPIIYFFLDFDLVYLLIFSSFSCFWFTSLPSTFVPHLPQNNCPSFITSPHFVQ